MHDIRLAIALIGFLAVAAFLLTLRLLNGRSKYLIDAFALIDVLLTLLYGQYVWGQLWIVKWIPLPSVLVLSNWFPILMGGLAAAVWVRLATVSVARRSIVMVAIVGAAAYSVFYFIPVAAPECSDQWAQPAQGVTWPLCLQTTDATCSAAAAATILNTLGIETTEQEMAELCLTRSGTTWLGLYHGLTTKLMGTTFEVEFIEARTSELPELAKSNPVLLCCRLEPQVAEFVPGYVEDDGWIPGAAHSVVYFGVQDDLHIIGDPTQGFEQWSSRDLGFLWTGTGLRIVESRAGESEG